MASLEHTDTTVYLAVTSSVTYCSEAKAVLVNEFDIAYWRANEVRTESRRRPGWSFSAGVLKL
jgi:hypothetical protein